MWLTTKAALLLVLSSVICMMSACSITQRVKTGQMAFDLKQYAVAVELLEREYKESDESQSKALLATLLGDSYDILNDHPAAVQWYERAKQFKNVDQKLAPAYKKNEQYAQAAELYMKLCQETNENSWCAEAKLCKAALNAKIDPKKTEISVVSANSRYADYSPAFFGTEYLVFTSDREGSIGDDVYNWTGNSFSDLYVVNLNGRKVNSFDAVINTAANEGTACFSKDLNEIYFTRCASDGSRDQYCQIYFSQRPNGFWMEPEVLPFFGSGTNYAHPCLIEQDSVLIFAAAPPSSDGTYDLYYSERVEDGWTSPEHMPPNINSLGNEKFPTSYGDTLYFASDELPGYGGYDLFNTHLENGTWSQPENMGRPINSGADDFGLAIDPAGTARKDIALQGYLSSSRNVGTGDDLFFFTQYEPEETAEEEPPITSTDKTSYKIFLAYKTVELLHVDDDPNKAIRGRLPLGNTQVTMQVGSEPTMPMKSPDERTGFVLEEIGENETYILSASKPGYLVAQYTFDTQFAEPLAQDTTINVDLTLEKIVYDKEINLDNIYYDYNKWDIRKDAEPTLDALLELLELNTDIKMQIAAHTDCRGELDFNENLSGKRALSVVNYLVDKGISATRLSSKGYGEGEPAVTCSCNDCTDEQHQANRRTTFKILR